MKYLYSFFMFACWLQVGCSQHETQNSSAPQPRPVPNLFVNKGEEGLQTRQDTTFYHHMLFSGYLYALYPTGDTSMVEGYIAGLPEGKTLKWYPSGQLAESRLYVAGKKEGIHRAWWENGKPKFVFEISNDEYTGDFKEWNSNGMLIKHFHYAHGQEEGSERLWWDDGTVKANYIIKNGKKYGLIGIKLCSNPYDSLNKK